MRPNRIPTGLNLALAVLALAGALVCLWTASHASPLLKVVAVLVFAFVNNTIFSLLHEAVHGIFHPNRRINDALGRLTAAMFPTGFTFQRLCHLGHHRRNRTDAELFDYYYEDDNRLVKWVQWYGILTGLYWLLPPLGSLLLLALPQFLTSRWLRGDSLLARQAGADDMLGGLDGASLSLLRLEVLFTVLFQAGLVSVLHLTLVGWLACYAAFGLNWSSLQFTDHAFSSRDVIQGAWNLRVPGWVRAFFLNYHHHKAHHQHPTVPWLHLSRYVDVTEERPTFWAIYRQMWRGPRPLPGRRPR